MDGKRFDLRLGQTQDIERQCQAAAEDVIKSDGADSIRRPRQTASTPCFRARRNGARACRCRNAREITASAPRHSRIRALRRAGGPQRRQASLQWFQAASAWCLRRKSKSKFPLPADGSDKGWFG